MPEERKDFSENTSGAETCQKLHIILGKHVPVFLLLFEFDQVGPETRAVPRLVGHASVHQMPLKRGRLRIRHHLKMWMKKASPGGWHVIPVNRVIGDGRIVGVERVEPFKTGRQGIRQNVGSEPVHGDVVVGSKNRHPAEAAVRKRVGYDHRVAVAQTASRDDIIREHGCAGLQPLRAEWTIHFGFGYETQGVGGSRNFQPKGQNTGDSSGEAVGPDLDGHGFLFKPVVEIPDPGFGKLTEEDVFHYTAFFWRVWQLERINTSAFYIQALEKDPRIQVLKNFHKIAQQFYL